MAVVNVNGISGINSITAQSNALDFYNSAGDTLSIGANLTGNINASGIVTASSGLIAGNTTINGNVNATGIGTFGPLNATRLNVTGNVDVIGVGTFSGGLQVGATTSITIGDTFIKKGAVGLGTTNTTGRNAGVGTATGTIIYNTTTQQLEVYSGPLGWFGGLGAFSATGGNIADGIEPGNGYKYHTFSATNSFVVDGSPKPVDILMVASGGGGGSRNGSFPGQGTDGGAGGGAGGLVVVSGYQLAPGTYTVTIAGGGAGGAAPPGNSQSPGTVGGDVLITSPVLTLTAKGGGFGGCGPLTPNPGGPGGSGGGEGAGGGTPGGPGARGPGIQPSQTQTILSYTQFGNPGGFCPTANSPYNGSGGGGAGGAGGNGNSGGPGVGGAGLQYPVFAGPLIGLPGLNPLNGYFAGGGGGGAHTASNNPGAGGSGGGGPGGAPNSDGNAGSQYSGGGGGGGGGVTPESSPFGRGASGGSGIVVIRYLS